MNKIISALNLVSLTGRLFTANRAVKAAMAQAKAELPLGLRIAYHIPPVLDLGLSVHSVKALKAVMADASVVDAWGTYFTALNAAVAEGLALADADDATRDAVENGISLLGAVPSAYAAIPEGGGVAELHAAVASAIEYRTASMH